MTSAARRASPPRSLVSPHWARAPSTGAWFVGPRALAKCDAPTPRSDEPVRLAGTRAARVGL